MFLKVYQNFFKKIDKEMDNRDNQNLGFIFDSTLPLPLYSLFINTSCQFYLQNISRLAVGHLQCSS